jgi:pimeloyl-ACP methyl ester carboxylesterase
MNEKQTAKRGFKYWIRLLSVGLVGGISLGCIVIEVIYIFGITQPVPSIFGELPQSNSGGEYQPVIFVNELEDIPLSGWYNPSENGEAVTLLHGFGSNRIEMKSRADFLVHHGYGVLLYDLRGHGESGGDERGLGWQDAEDVKTALKFLSKREELVPNRIGILGFSIGGQITI